LFGSRSAAHQQNRRGKRRQLCNPRAAECGHGAGLDFVMFGSNMGPGALAQAPSLPLPTKLEGTSVKVTSNGISVDCPIICTSAGQIAAIMVSDTPPDAATRSTSLCRKT
jgi:uncharacterized protein (TIGR03437 family)